MKINVLNYVNNLNVAKAYLSANPNMKLTDKVTNLSISTFMPLIVCAYFVAKIEGRSEELDRKIEQLKTFYKYDEIVGVTELMGDSNE